VSPELPVDSLDGVPERQANAGGEGLSLQTLVVAAAASAAAAVIVSHVWKDGTVIAAAMTPVIVAIVKELLQRPMESEIVRKPVQKVSGIASSRLPVTGSRTATRGDELADAPPSTEPGGLRRDYGRGDGVAPAEGELTPMRTYGSSRRRPLHLKIAIVTGLIAFLIAAAALTLPELLFGGAVSSHHDTTLFGGGGSKSDKKKSQDSGTSTQPNQTQQQKTTPATPPPTTGGKAPTKTTPSQTSPQQSPQQTTPQQTTPVPTTPTPPTP
jgi:hypothetical protein